MADYTLIDPNTLLPGEPWTSAKALAAFENPEAIAEGAPGAPRVQGLAIASEYNGLPVVTISAADTVALGEGMDARAGTLTTTSTEVVVISYRVPSYTGSARFRCSHFSGGSGGFFSFLRLYKNGVLVQGFSTPATDPVLRTVDLTFVPGDLIEWRLQSQTSGIVYAAPGNVTANDGYVPKQAFWLNSQKSALYP
jgi:hypothetical protein